MQATDDRADDIVNQRTHQRDGYQPSKAGNRSMMGWPAQSAANPCGAGPSPADQSVWIYICQE